MKPQFRGICLYSFPGKIHISLNTVIILVFRGYYHALKVINYCEFDENKIEVQIPWHFKQKFPGKFTHIIKHHSYSGIPRLSIGTRGNHVLPSRCFQNY